MTTFPSDLLPEGLADRLPIDAARVTTVMRAVLETMDAHGYDRVSPPLMEFEESLGRRMSGKTGNGMRQSFRFVDPASLRMLAVRSDITPQIGRIASTAMANAPRPLRLCYAGEIALIHADQLDPTRQRMQSGAELIGSDTARAASEIVMLAIETLKAAGATEISVDFTLPDLVDILAVEAMPLDAGQIAVVRRELDTKDAGGLKQAGGEAYLPLLYATGDFDHAIGQLANIDAGGVLGTRIQGLKNIVAQVGDHARITLDPTERHGFEYQSWFGFTIYAGNIRGAVGRGGTYTVPASIGALEAEPATGFSLYIDAVADALAKPAQRDTLYLTESHDKNAAARLRAIGWRTITALSDAENPAALGCTHRLNGAEPVAL